MRWTLAQAWILLGLVLALAWFIMAMLGDIGQSAAESSSHIADILSSVSDEE